MHVEAHFCGAQLNLRNWEREESMWLLENEQTKRKEKNNTHILVPAWMWAC